MEGFQDELEVRPLDIATSNITQKTNRPSDMSTRESCVFHIVTTIGSK